LGKKQSNKNKIIKTIHILKGKFKMNNIEWEKFKRTDLAVKCDSEEDAQDFINECYNRGFIWLNETEKVTKWDKYKKNTFYAGFQERYITFGSDTLINSLMGVEVVTYKKQYSINIETDGKVTTAKLFDSGLLVKEVCAKCNPVDTFDFKIGATLAFERLGLKDKVSAEKVSEDLSSDFKVNDFVKSINNENSNKNCYMKQGKIIAVENKSVCVEFFEKITYGHNGEGKGKQGHCWWLCKNDIVKVVIVEKAERKVQVGDWIEVKNIKIYKDAFKVGDILQVIALSKLSTGGVYVRTKTATSCSCIFADRIISQPCGYINTEDYKILDNYDPPKFTPYIKGTYTNNTYGNIGVLISRTDSVGQELHIGDIVDLYCNGKCFTKTFVTNNFKTPSPDVKLIKSCSYEDVKNGTVVGNLKCVKIDENI
jgi:hypothetical protein